MSDDGDDLDVLKANQIRITVVIQSLVEVAKAGKLVIRSPVVVNQNLIAAAKAKRLAIRNLIMVIRHPIVVNRNLIVVSQSLVVATKVGRLVIIEL